MAEVKEANDSPLPAKRKQDEQPDQPNKKMIQSAGDSHDSPPPPPIAEEGNGGHAQPLLEPSNGGIGDGIEDGEAAVVDRKGKGKKLDDSSDDEDEEEDDDDDSSDDSDDSDSDDDSDVGGDDDSELEDDPLAEVDLDNILPAKTRRRGFQPVFRQW